MDQVLFFGNYEGKEFRRMMNPFNTSRQLFRFVPTLCAAILIWILLPSHLRAEYVIETESTLSWLALGDSSAKFSVEDQNFSTNVQGRQQELAIWQDRNSHSHLFSGLHLQRLEYSASAVDASGNRYQPEYQSLNLFYSLGIDWEFANFLHLQPFVAYGLGIGNFQISHTATDGTQRSFPEKEGITDIGIYGVNLILEVSGKLWLGVAQNYFVESRTFKYEYLGKTSLEPQNSTTFLIVWNWERVPLEAIDPRASFFDF